jgi:hypothetical protein
VHRALKAAACLVDPLHPLGIRARSLLPAATGLSPQNVELCLRECLEIAPSDAELRALCCTTPVVPAAHVLLSANVFVGAHRAIAIGLAASELVSVRPSRREPQMTELLREAGAPFRIAYELRPSAGDHVWAYGSDVTLRSVRSALPSAVTLHAHGSGFGVAVVSASSPPELEAAASALARDVVPFDQRGCLSPRIALVSGNLETARRLAEALVAHLARFEEQVPRGELSADERAAERRYRDLAAYSGELFAETRYAVSLRAETPGEPLLVPPVGRNVHVVSTADVGARLDAMRDAVTAVGVFGPDSLRDRLVALMPAARVSALGCMQRPPLDGPVDRRTFL